MQEFMEGRQLVAFWDDWLSNRHMKHLTKEQLIRGAYVARSVERLGLSQPRILDIGCAHGWLSGSLLRLGPVTGVDMSEKAIEAARTLVPTAQFMSGDFVAMDLPENSFDVIVCLESIAYMDQQAFIAKVDRLLRASGYLIVTTPNWPVWERARRQRASPATLKANHLSMQSLSELVSTRLRIVRTTTLNPFGASRLADSNKLNRAAALVVPERRVLDFKGLFGKLGLGGTLFVLARKP